MKDDAPPSRLKLTTDEAKSYYYAHLVPAEDMKPGRCEIGVSDNARIDLAVESLKELRLDCEAMGIGKAFEIKIGGATNSFRLCLDKVPPADVECGKKIARTWDYDKQAKTLTIEVDAADVPLKYELKF